ncbi:MAG TPA: putative quinol monooxygenase [Gaiellaceae bacterium]
MSFVLVVRLTVQEGKEDEVAATLRELGDATRREPGCELYIPTQAKDDPRSFLIYEQYVDAAALDDHTASDHFQRLAAGTITSLLESPRERTFYETL